MTTSCARCDHALRIEHCPTCSTRALLAELQTTVEHLAANLLPGTARPWRAPQVSAEKRAELDRQAREDRLHIASQGDLPAHLKGQGVVVPPGESPAPYDLEIADLLSDILMAGDLLADRAEGVVVADLIDWAGSWALGLVDPDFAPAPASSAFADPRAHWTFLSDTVEYLALLEPDLLEQIADTARMHIDRAAPTLGLILDGQLLDGRCPWCDGRTGAHPLGGEKTLRVRMPKDDDARPLVVCEGGRCDPGDNSGLTWRGLPAWDLLNEGEWLWHCIKVAAGEDVVTCRCGRPVLRTGKAGRPAVHCSEHCRREADAERQRHGRVAS